MFKAKAFILSVSLLCASAGCSDIVKFAVDKTQPRGDQREGVVFYVGGAGPVGNIGSFDVPRGLRDAGFGGAVEVFPWQSWTHAGDQLNLSRNRTKAAELADKIQRFRRRHPEAPIDIIALSAGTGIATFALEYLPESVKIDNAVYLGCSMSSEHDMTRALRRVRGKLYVLYSMNDAILSNFVWYTGTVDRKESSDGIAGLEGFHIISSPYPDTKRQYEKLVNVPYRSEFREAGYDGGHVSGTARTFVQFYLAPALMKSDRRLVGGPRAPYRSPYYAKSSRPPERDAPVRRSARTNTSDDPLRGSASGYDDGTVPGPDTDPGRLDADAAPALTEGSAGPSERRGIDEGTVADDPYALPGNTPASPPTSAPDDPSPSAYYVEEGARE